MTLTWCMLLLSEVFFVNLLPPAVWPGTALAGVPLVSRSFLAKSSMARNFWAASLRSSSLTCVLASGVLAFTSLLILPCSMSRASCRILEFVARLSP